MKNINERVIKYLSDLMTLEERNAFESELKTNAALLSHFNKIKKNITEFTHNDYKQKLNENYFNSILPKARERIDKRRVTKIKSSAVYALSSVAAVIILLVLLVPGSPTVDFSINEYEDEISNIAGSELNLDELLTENISYNYSTINIEDVNNGHYSEYINELTENYTNSNVFQTIDINDSYNYIESLEEDELNNIITELKEIKFL